jgi:heme exporter protein A
VQLVAENLVLSRAGRTVVDGLSMRLGAGEALLLKGPNGSGKTTLLRALAGLLAPTAGFMRLDDAPAEREPGELAHFIGHLDGIKSHLTVAENLAFWADYLDDAGTTTAVALESFGLTPLADIPAGYLSAGQKRRLALARLVAVRRPLWLLDEPTVSLDAEAVELLVAAIAAHLVGGGLAVIATHVDIALDGTRTLQLGAAAAAPGARS